MSEIRDISLWPDGRLKIEWVRHHMPLLNGLEKEFSEEKPFINFYGSYEVKSEVSSNGDKIKKITIFNKKKAEIPNDASVDTLLVIIKFGWFDTTAKRIVGKFSFDGVLEMHKGDTVTISKGMYYPKQTFEVIESGKDILLNIKGS